MYCRHRTDCVEDDVNQIVLAALRDLLVEAEMTATAQQGFVDNARKLLAEGERQLAVSISRRDALREAVSSP